MSWLSRGQTIATGTEARQSVLDRPVLAVLVISTVVAAIALGANWLGLW